ncbi:MAG: endonuclease MutS2 [Synergistaceae bacterium]
MYLNERVYSNLEIDKILRQITKYCRSELGVYVASITKPAKDIDELKKRHEIYISIENYRNKKSELPWLNGLTPVAQYLCEAEEEGILTGAQLIKIKNLLSLSMKLKDKLNEEKESFPAFSLITQYLREFAEEIAALSVIDEEGRIYDFASEKLKEARDFIRILREEIKKKSNNIMNDSAITSMLQEKVLVIRNGRHSFLVRQDALSVFPGTVVDRSGSGNSVYMEPHSLLKLNNEFTSYRNIEQHEEQKILRTLTALILKRVKAIIDAEHIIGTIDLYYALSEKQKIDKWTIPQITKKMMFDLTKAKHPLLNENATPIDIKCGENFNILVITGPNTGGKTVALKTAAVCITLGWMGFPIPAGEGSKLGDINAIYADIGDEQSIEQSLSTFSAHVANVTDMLKNVSPNSLVLLDELGAGTDPEEGAALGIALLEWLKDKGSLVLATTHHNPIKRYALITDKIETASVEFNSTTLSPTYRILIGIPGKSNAILIAKKLGMPEEITKRASQAINGHEVSMEGLIEELQGKREIMERETIEVEKARTKLEKLKEDYEEKIKQIEEKKDKLIADADKKAVSIVRNAEESAKALIKNLGNAEIESNARRELEKKRSHFHKIEDSAIKREEKKIAQQSVTAKSTVLKVGDTVRIIGTKGTATVLELKGKKARVQAGVVEIEVPLTKLTTVSESEKKKPKNDVQIKVSRPVGVPSSIMVRKMTVDEAMPIVEQYLDQAYCAGYDSVTVIHGRGEGILRREVQELCKRTPYVLEHNLGGPNEGGYGVTVVRFKK